MAAPSRKVWVDNWALHSQVDTPAQSNVQSVEPQVNGVPALTQDIGHSTKTESNIISTEPKRNGSSSGPENNGSKAQPVLQSSDDVWNAAMGRNTRHDVHTDPVTRPQGRHEAESRLWVADIPTAYKPARNDLQDSRWASQPLKQQTTISRPPYELRYGPSVTFIKAETQLPEPDQSLTTVIQPRQSSSGSDLGENVRPVPKSHHGSSFQPAPFKHLPHDIVHGTKNDQSELQRPDKILPQESPRPDIVASCPIPPPAKINLADNASRTDTPRQGTLDKSAGAEPSIHTYAIPAAPISEKSYGMPLTAEALVATTSARPADNAGSDGLPLKISDIAGENNDGITIDTCRLTPDIRGRTPEQTWTEQDWNNTRRPQRKEWEVESLGEVSSDWEPPSLLNEYIDFWLERVDEPSCPRFLQDQVPNHERCDVDTNTGELMPECADVTTMPDISANPNTARAQRIQTSDTKISHRIRALKIKEMNKAEEERVRQMEQEEAKVREGVANRVNPYKCRIPSHFRPAREEDMEEVAALYNQEVKEGWRAPDQDSVSPQSWNRIFANCQSHNMPFIVALSSFISPLGPTDEAKVIGFAYLDVAARGVMGSLKTNSKHSAKLFFLVGPQYRRNRVGTALLDLTMSFVSISYNPKEQAYHWTESQDPVYFRPQDNPRTWKSLQVEVYVQSINSSKEETAKGEEYQFIWNWLEAHFNWHLISHSECFAQANNLSLQPWLDRLVFEHSCRFG